VKNKPQRKIRLGAIALSVLTCAAVHAGDTFFNFDTDPTLGGSGFLFAGNHLPSAWCSGLGTATNGNPSTGGYLSIADGNVGGMALVAVFPDIDAGYPIKAFHLTADVRAGNSGNANGRPADGFSISYCREGDQILVNATNGIAMGAAGGDDAATTQSPLGSTDFENGTKSGVAVIFDAWQGNMLPDTGPGGTPGPDVEGIEVRVDDHTLLQLDMSGDRNGGCYSPTNLICGPAVCADSGTEQTGPWANDGGAPDGAGTLQGLCWARLDVELTTNKQVTVIWKGATLVDHYQLTNYPNHRGRLVIMGRDGGNFQNDHFDNIHLVTTPAIEATFDHVGVGPNLNQFTILISDNGSSVVTNVSSVILDGVDVTAQCVVTKNGTKNNVVYTQVPFFAPHSTHLVSATWETVLGQTLSAVNQSFTVPGYLVLPPSYSVPAGSIDLTKVGFNVNPIQTATGNPNRNYWTDEQLEGLHGTNAIDFTSLSNSPDGIVWEGMLYFNNGTASGQFPYNNPSDFSPFGVPAPAFTVDDNTSLSCSAYLYFATPGLYYLGVNSDDGFRVSFYNNAKDILGAEIPGVLSFDGGRGVGASENIGIISVAQAGYYGTRVMYYNGGGGAALEFYSASTPGTGTTNVLVNDTNVVGAVLAYRSSSAAPAYVGFAEPPLDDTQYAPNGGLHYQIYDAGTTVAAGAISLTVNGGATAPTIVKTGGTNDITLAAPPSLWPVGTNTVSLAYTDSAGSNLVHTYTFNVLFYVTLPTNTITALGSGFNPGFRMFAYQAGTNNNILNGWQNTCSFNMQAAEGFYTGNEADLSTFTHSGQFWNSTVINYSQNSSGALTANGDFQVTDTPTPHPDSTAPGLPGPSNVGTGPDAMDNDCWVAKTFLQFNTPGLYLMGVNSDDGFRVISGDRRGPGRSIVSVLAPSNVAGDIPAMDMALDFGGALPVPPIIAQAVICDPPWPTAMPNNAAALAGKIAICHRTPAGGTAAHTYWAQQAGAIAVVFVDQDDVGPTRQVGVFGTGSPTPTIPVVMIGYTAGTNLLTIATSNSASPVVLTLGDGGNANLGQFNGGRGSSDTTFYISVPAAGVYPITLYWENGGGDANCEWFTQDLVSGVKTLINDVGSPVSAFIQRNFPAGAHFNPITINGNNATLSWTGEGELEFSYDVIGPWFQAISQSNPQNVPLNNGLPVNQTFYRVRSY
jgi:hypothetical protein